MELADERHAGLMRLAIAQGELARGHTGDNPWVGCVLVGPDGEVLACGHTQGPGENHAEIAALAEKQRHRVVVHGTRLVESSDLAATTALLTPPVCAALDALALESAELADLPTQPHAERSPTARPGSPAGPDPTSAVLAEKGRPVRRRSLLACAVGKTVISAS